MKFLNYLVQGDSMVQGGSSLIWSCSIKYILVNKHSWLKEPLFVWKKLIFNVGQEDLHFSQCYWKPYQQPRLTKGLKKFKKMSTKFHAFKLWICQYLMVGPW